MDTESSESAGILSPKARLWAGRVLSGLVTAFLLFDGVMKFFLDKLPPQALEAGKKLEFPMAFMPALGVVLLASTLLYAYPRTAVLGAILLTGYLGGAVSVHVRVSDPWLSHTLFPVYLGVMAWGGLYLRDRRVAALLPWGT